MDDLFDFLQKDDFEPTVDANLVEFSGFDSGFIAPWLAQVLYRQGSESDFEQEEIGYALKRKAGEWGYFYYFPTDEVAEAARNVMGAEYGATAMWCFRAVTADVLNFTSDKAREAFGPDLFYDCRIAGIGSRKYVEFQHITLPSAVSAIARLQSRDVPAFDTSPLLDLEDSEYGWGEMDEDEQRALRMRALPLLGGKVGGEEVERENAFFWQQRTAIWKALGEDNPEASQLKGSGGDFTTTSDALDSALRIYYQSPWPAPLWMDLRNPKSPRADAMTKAGKRLSVPVIARFFRDEAEAKAAVGETATTATDAAAPAIPQEWADIPEDFKAEVRKLKEAGGNKPAFLKAGGENAFMCTWDDIQPWLEFV